MMMTCVMMMMMVMLMLMMMCVCVCVCVPEQFCVMLLSECSGVCDDSRYFACLCIVMFILD